LLASGQVGDAAEFPGVGQALVVIGAEPGMLPAGLAAGQRVAVVPGALPGAGASSEEAAKVPDPVLGVVHAVSRPETSSGKGAVTVLVDAGAVRRAALMAEPRVAVLGGGVKEVS
jgi:hypothetical protein